jgi:hypothetical protein
MLLICVLRDLFALSQLHQKRRKEPVVEILFEDLVDLDMMMQVLDGALDEGQPLVERDSEDLLEVNGAPIRAEVQLGQPE